MNLIIPKSHPFINQQFFSLIASLCHHLPLVETNSRVTLKSIFESEADVVLGVDGSMVEQRHPKPLQNPFDLCSPLINRI